VHEFSKNLAATSKVRASQGWHEAITGYSQQDAIFLGFIYSYRRSTCFRRFLRPSLGAHGSSISSTVAASSSIVWQYLKLYVQLFAPDDVRRNRLKHVERL
jgi:hypothetical protein